MTAFVRTRNLNNCINTEIARQTAEEPRQACNSFPEKFHALVFISQWRDISLKIIKEHNQQLRITY
jgi:hypothetical protein